MAPTRDDRIEGWLKQNGVTWDYEPTLMLDDVDIETSHRNQARVTVEPLSNEFVNSYATSMENGETFPPIVVYNAGSDRSPKWVVIDGNHRIAAATKNDWDTFPAYIVKAEDPRVITVLTYEANAKHGIPTTPQERVTQALHLIDQGVAGATAAKMMGVNYQTLTSKYRTLRTKRHLQGLNIDTNRLSDAMLSRLGTIQNDNVITELTQLVMDSGMRSNELSDLITRINSVRTEKEQLGIVKDAREMLKGEIKATAGGLYRLPNHVRRAASVFGQAISLELTEEEAAGLDPEYRKDLYARAQQAQEQIERLVKVLR